MKVNKHNLWNCQEMSEMLILEVWNWLLDKYGEQNKNWKVVFSYKSWRPFAIHTQILF
jgi:hypothetical protein